jgi:hypothetical protein
VGRVATGFGCGAGFSFAADSAVSKETFSVAPYAPATRASDRSDGR